MQKTFIVPINTNESFHDYTTRITAMNWQFVGDRSLQVANDQVTLDGDQPPGAGFEEVVTP